MIKRIPAIVLAAALLSASAQATRTYHGSITTTYATGPHQISANYTITTDGTFGLMSSYNFKGYTLRLSSGSSISNSSALGIYGFTEWVYATPTELSIDFAKSDAILHLFNQEDAICFLAANYSCTGDPSPATMIFSNALLNYGYVPQPAVLTVIATAVPEPASWAMMIAGFGLVGAIRRRRVLAAA